MNKSFKTLAAAMLLGSTAIAPLAIAQDAGTGATTTPPAATGGATGTAPAGTVTPDATTGGAAGTTGTTAQDTTAATGTGTYLTEQAENHISVSDFMGQAIYTADNQSIGDINDLLVEDNGGVVAAVVGVGGFLGIGEKNVAIPFDKITITRVMDEDAAAMNTTDGTATTAPGTTGTGTTATGATGTTATTGSTTAEAVADAEVRLTTTETAESLRNAPEFRTLDDQAADGGTTTMGTTDGTTTSSTDNN